MNYYEILGVTCYATNSEIGMAFRALAKRYHPDLNKNPDAKNKFIQIYEAYSILKDEKKKKVYDEFILNKNTNVKKETEQAKTYTKWEEDAKQEAKYYSEAKYSVFKKNIIGGVFVVGIRILFLFIVAVVWAFLDLNNNALSFILGIIVAAIVCFFLASIFDRFNEK